MANERDKHVCVPSEEKRPFLANERDVEESIHCGEENGMPNDTECPLSNPSGQHCQISVLSSKENATTEEINDTVYNHINGRLRNSLSQVSFGGWIFKVPDYLRNVNKRAYEPHILAIGPYHRGEDHLKEMEKHKVHYLKKLLQEKGEDNLRSYVSEMGHLEAKARTCYIIESVKKIKPEEFVEMMLLDACFIVQLFRKSNISGEVDFDDCDDPVLIGGWVRTALRRDLLLVENQLPFFVLQKFFDITAGSNYNFYDLIYNFFRHKVPAPRYVPEDGLYMEDVVHLLDLIHRSWFPLCSEIRKTNDSRNIGDGWGFNIRCSTQLRESGIKFMKDEERNLFDITFENGTLKIPMLKIVDSSESFFRNLIAYEMFLQDPDRTYVFDYVRFMDCLMNTSKDVELLCRREIIVNGLGDDEVLAQMFNRLCDNVTCFTGNFLYAKTRNDIEEHCRRNWNKWIANLRHNYFNTPWALISFFAAALLLLLTLAQTVFAVLSYIFKE